MLIYALRFQRTMKYSEPLFYCNPIHNISRKHSCHILNIFQFLAKPSFLMNQYLYLDYVFYNALPLCLIPL